MRSWFYKFSSDNNHRVYKKIVLFTDRLGKNESVDIKNFVVDLVDLILQKTTQNGMVIKAK